ncbi:unnamed protein product [Prunus armeniaca]
MASSVEAKGSWTTQEDIVLCECWVKVSHYLIMGNEMKFSHMWRKIHELGKWRDALEKARDNIRSGQILPMRSYKHKCGLVPWGKAKKTPFHDSSGTDSSLDSPMDQDSPFPRMLRPIRRKAAKAKRGSTSNNECAQRWEQIAKNNALRIERDLKREEADKARHKAFAIQRQQAQEQDIEDREMKIMAMDISHMSLETKSYWKLKRRDVMRRKLFHDNGPSNMDWLNDQNH